MDYNRKALELLEKLAGEHMNDREFCGKLEEIAAWISLDQISDKKEKEEREKKDQKTFSPLYSTFDQAEIVSVDGDRLVVQGNNNPPCSIDAYYEHFEKVGYPFKVGDKLSADDCIFGYWNGELVFRLPRKFVIFHHEDRYPYPAESFRHVTEWSYKEYIVPEDSDEKS